ncbi:ubiquinol-cytochrome c reductase cytochrome b subunit [Raineyella antarctica]|uniref:Cytochrome bc1 complex cytochrome b subunit n=1 Tax=Raineyella antarctica TaxID=1577474 RepID=A0A1G6HG75_9ACTN|nr:cytochrome b N-terminal domain-containing protein [Raineyella antarctica]SDB92446.1 ubiquinol-cytochrome c reductase cytochrome b subunit [Raineyella antarctica]
MTTTGDHRSRTEAPDAGNWSTGLARWIAGLVPRGQWLPGRQPAYVASWIYVFGVTTLAAMVVVIGTGILLSVRGANWWHHSAIGHFVNSLHLWSVELFLAAMTVHLWGKFFMAAWRGRRGMTWFTGVLTFAASIGTAFTGYVMQNNLDSQWISTQAKDGLNAVGVGARFNAMNFSQMVLWHVSLLPLVLGVLVVLHLLLVRRHGVVPPIGATVPDGSEEPVEMSGTATEEVR